MTEQAIHLCGESLTMLGLDGVIIQNHACGRTLAVGQAQDSCPKHIPSVNG